MENHPIKTDYQFAISSLPDLLRPEQFDAVLNVLQDLRIELLSCRYQQMETATIVQWPRTLPDTLLYLPVGGEVDVRVGSRSARIGPGELLIVPDSVPHGLVSAAPESLDFADHATAAASGERGVRSSAFAVHIQLSTTPGRAHLDLEAVAITRLPEPATFRVRLALLTHLLAVDPRAGRAYGDLVFKPLLIDHILTAAPIRGGFRPVDPRIAEAMTTIASDPGRAHMVADLARQEGLSPSRFSALFRTATGLSPKQFLTQHRLGQVCRLLIRHPDMTIDEIARLADFVNGPQLHKAFRRQYGLTPAEFRLRARE